RDCQKVSRAVLAEPESAILTQWDATRATLAALGCQDVSRITF
ncbi:MAG: cytidine deaminase, partial [Serratia sp. (in: enterobacteria)]